MTSLSLPQPGVIYGLYPERNQAAQSQFFPSISWRAILSRTPQAPKHYRRFAKAVTAHGEIYGKLDDNVLLASLPRLRTQLRGAGFTDPALGKTVAFVREMIRRQTGIETYVSQIIATRIMLAGKLAEMQTGEGKTYAIAMAALTAALAEIPTHVVTANDYLVERDAKQLQPIAQRLGLSVGMVISGMPAEQRRENYHCDITYCTARELAFDYLKDKATGDAPRSDLHRRAQYLATPPTHRPLLRGLCLAIVDEADSIFLDESYTPLILSQDGKNAIASDAYQEALEIAALMVKNQDFSVAPYTHRVELTARGRLRLKKHCETLSGLWRNTHYREEIITQALLAKHAYRRDRDYLVKEGEVHIIDATTGRIAEGRKWSRGLHTLIELKEGCSSSGQRHTLAQITYQRFFPRYLHLCGTSATLTDSRAELFATYHLDLVPVPLHKPSRRTDLGTRMLLKRRMKWHETIQQARQQQLAGRPVLIGTDSVGDSEILSAWCDRNTIAHRVLNARKDQEEAAIIANAGIAGRVTIATNMAGRGTDIKLSSSARKAGGLHVISCQLNASRRIDRQLYGRCGRQGDPGSVETILSLEDPLIQATYPQGLLNYLQRRYAKQGELPRWLGRIVARIAQLKEENRYRQLRRQLKKADVQQQKLLGISGPQE